MTVIECAKLFGKSPQFVLIGLRRGILLFSYAVKMSNRGCHCRNRTRRMTMKDKWTRKEQHVDQVICYDGLEACCSKKAKEWFR